MAMDDAVFRVLSLDGGGSKGMYSLGVLNELEAKCKRPLCEVFDLVYGTSTGAIIASLIATGWSVPDIDAAYRKHVPSVMKRWSRYGRSRALRSAANAIFADKTFQEAKTRLGVVATNVDTAHPFVFKSHVDQSHGQQDTFVPGGGVTLKEAVLASCSAYPLFSKVTLDTANQGRVTLMDGGYVGNNPSLHALTDALGAMGREASKVRLLNVGVGDYRTPIHHSVFYYRYWLAMKALDCNTKTLEVIRNKLLMPVQCVRVSETFLDQKYTTSLIESRPKKLAKLFDLGRGSYSISQDDIHNLLWATNRER